MNWKIPFITPDKLFSQPTEILVQHLLIVAKAALYSFLVNSLYLFDVSVVHVSVVHVPLSFWRNCSLKYPMLDIFQVISLDFVCLAVQYDLVDESASLIWLVLFLYGKWVALGSTGTMTRAEKMELSKQCARLPIYFI